jgi:ATP-dependent DNA ligase
MSESERRSATVAFDFGIADASRENVASHRAELQRRRSRSARAASYPMLSRSAPLPVGGGWAYELKWDQFRAIASTEDGLRVHSRRECNMTSVTRRSSTQT